MDSVAPIMTKVLFSTTILTLLILMACSAPADMEIVAPTATPQPVITETSVPTAEPATVSPPPEAESARAPSPTATTAPAPTATPEPSPTSTPLPTATSVPTVVPTPTELPTATPAPTATAIAMPTLEPTPTPAAAPSPTSTPTSIPVPEVPAGTWRGITLAAENRCSPYDPDEYRYSPSVEPRIVAAQGGIYGPYTGSWFESIRETDIEHIVARSEAHDSGLCAATAATRKQFASDLLNLTLASPSVNRHQKVDKDPAEWLPVLNQCWYVARVIQVRQQYALTIDRSEAEAIDRVLAGCASTGMVILDPGESTGPTPTASPSGDVDALALYDDNGNGRITCSEARAHDIAPVRRGHPAYQYMRDGDGDGVVCE